MIATKHKKGKHNKKQKRHPKIRLSATTESVQVLGRACQKYDLRQTSPLTLQTDKQNKLL